MEKVLALDIGEKRTGIAIADSMGIIVKPLKTIPTNEIISELEEISKEYEIPNLVIGLPIHMDGTEENANTKFVKKQCQTIKKHFENINIVFVDERLSSKIAEARLKDLGTKINKQNKGLIDMHAAAVVLEQYFADLDL